MTENYYKLGTVELTQLLSDPDFYEKNVAFLFMRDNAIRTIENYNKALITKKSDCSGCKGNTEPTAYVQNTLAKFLRTLRQLMELKNSTPLAGLREYIEDRLGYSPQQFRVYYSKDGKSGKEFIVF